MKVIALINTHNNQFITAGVIKETKNFTVVIAPGYGSIKVRKDGSCTGIHSYLVRA